MLRTLLTLALVASLASTARAVTLANVPSTMSYQGSLTDAGGTPVPDGNYDFTFRLYDQPTAGNLLWTEQQLTVPVVRGVFSVMLGSVTPISADFQGPRWLSVSLQNGAPFSPRVALGAAPYALALRLPFTGEAVSDSAALVVNNRGAGLDLVTDHAVRVGPPSTGIVLDARQTGDASVRLPGDAVSAPEIADEPGLSSFRDENALDVTSTTEMQDIATTDITTPRDGLVLVMASGGIGFYGAAPGSMKYVNYQIDTVAGGWPIPGEMLTCGSAYTTAGVTWSPFSTVRIYWLPAGTHTFRLEAYQVGPGGEVWFTHPRVTAIYLPTAYGAVTDAVSNTTPAMVHP